MWNQPESKCVRNIDSPCSKRCVRASPYMRDNGRQLADLSTRGIQYSCQWRRQLWGTGARAPLDFQQFHF